MGSAASAGLSVAVVEPPEWLMGPWVVRNEVVVARHQQWAVVGYALLSAVETMLMWMTTRTRATLVF